MTRPIALAIGWSLGAWLHPLMVLAADHMLDELEGALADLEVIWGAIDA